MFPLCTFPPMEGLGEVGGSFGEVGGHTDYFFIWKGMEPMRLPSAKKSAL